MKNTELSKFIVSAVIAGFVTTQAMANKKAAPKKEGDAAKAEAGKDHCKGKDHKDQCKGKDKCKAEHAEGDEHKDEHKEDAAKAPH